VRKAALVLLIVLAAGLAAVPYWFGIQAEKTYGHIIQRLESKGYIKVSSSHFDRGFISSTAEIDFTLQGHSEPIHAVNTIRHGPFPLSRLLSGDFDFRPVQAIVETKLSGGGDTLSLDAVTASTRVAPDGGGITQINAGGVRARVEDGGDLTADGIGGTLRFRPSLTRVSGTLSAQTLRMTKQNGTTTLSGIDTTFDVYSGLLGLSLGSAEVNVDSLTAEAVAGSPPISLTGLSLQSSAEDRGGAIDTSLAMGVKRFQTADAKGGPGEFAIELRNLDAGALHAFEDQAREIRAADVPPEQQGAKMMGGLMDLVAGLGRRNPEIEVTRLRFVMPEGELTGSGRVTLDGKKLGDGPLAILNAIDAEARLSLPADMVRAMVGLDVGMELDRLQADGKIPALSAEQRQSVIENTIPQRLDAWAAARQLVSDGDLFSFEAVFKDGLLEVNGKPFNPMQAQATLSP
jgi:uncharacterized protein YdgA (DUF945 family)